MYTLLHSLFGAGWKLLRKRPQDDLPLLNVTVGPVLAANRWIRLSPDASHVGRPYLQCLAKLDQSSSFRTYLREHGVYSVQHGQSDKFYEALVSENPARLLKVDFEADVSVPEARSLRDTRATAVAGQSKTGKFKLPESFRWGAVSFKYHQPPKGSEHGSLQCDCVRKSHRRKNAKGQGIPCTWTCKFTSEEERLALVRRMKHWVVLGFDCQSHRSHQALRKSVTEIPLEDLPTDIVLNEKMPPADRQPTDDECAEAEAADAGAPGKGKPAGKAKAKHKAKPKPKPKGKDNRKPAASSSEPAPKRPRVSEEVAGNDLQDEAASDPESKDEAASDPESNSSASSASSSSDESSSSSSSSS